MNIVGIEGMSQQQLASELQAGGRFVVFDYCISVCVITFKRSSEIHFVRAGQGTGSMSLGYTLLSFFFGWWGFPFGLVYTPMAIITNLGGGRDVTAQIAPHLLAARPN
jgi:hypothetical protein